VILKKKDSISARRLELNLLLDKFDLPDSKRWRVDRELKNLGKGERGEKDAAYHIGFYGADSNNHFLIHDLRLEYGDFTAQIDHLLINRFLELFVLESKSYGDTLEITKDGAFIAHYGDKSYAIASPIEQNDRHIHLLRKAINAADIVPRRLGVAIPIKYHNVVLIDPATKIDRPPQSDFDTSNVLHADRWVKEYSKSDNVSLAEVATSLAKVVASETCEKFGRQLVGMHKPGSFNYKEQLGITDEDLAPKGSRPQIAEPEKAYKASRTGNRTGNYCAACKADIHPTVANYCFNNKHRFNGRAYCRNCQGQFA